MRVLELNSKLLCNQEVLHMITEPIPKHLMGPTDYQDYRTVIHQTTKYLSDPMVPARFSKEAIQGLLMELMEFDLTKLEKLTIINTRPLVLVELVPLIEAIEARFTVDQQKRLLELLEKHLPFERPVDEEEEEEE